MFISNLKHTLYYFIFISFFKIFIIFSRSYVYLFIISCYNKGEYKKHLDNKTLRRDFSLF
jgi:predicted CDP-diglyceride synthetase/phosphatidate cytidylyltransferase